MMTKAMFYKKMGITAEKEIQDSQIFEQFFFSVNQFMGRIQAQQPGIQPR